MKKLFIATSIAFCLSTNVALANNQSSNAKDKITDEKKTELIGFGSGMATGALVGGPIGAIVGGIFGVLVAEDINNDKIIAASKQDLRKASGQLSAEKYENERLQSQLLALQQQQMTHLASMEDQSNEAFLDQLKNFETRLMFKTASSAIEDIYTQQLDTLASVLNEHPKLRISVTGYADMRGDKQYNQQLSEQRAIAVKDYLLSKQVQPSQMEVSGAGELTSELQPVSPIQTESSTLDGKTKHSSIEDLFFARKVNIQFLNNTSQMTAAK